MDTLKSLQVFRAIVEHGSFTKAAEQLSMSVPMASKHMTHLENHVQAKLLHRSNRRQSLTEIGQRYYQESSHALDTLETARIAANQGTIEPKGTLKIAAPVWFATPYVARLLADFQKQFPHIQLALYLENRHTDLIADGYDLALRVTAAPQENLIVKPLTTIKFYYVASPDYLKQHGTPQTVESLRQHHGILPNYVQIDTPLPQTHHSNNTVMLAEMAKSGMGIAALPEWLIMDAIEKGELVRLFPLSEKAPTLYAAYMNREFLSAKMRVLIDFLVEKL